MGKPDPFDSFQSLLREYATFMASWGYAVLQYDTPLFYILQDTVEARMFALPVINHPNLNENSTVVYCNTQFDLSCPLHAVKYYPNEELQSRIQ